MKACGILSLILTFLCLVLGICYKEFLLVSLIGLVMMKIFEKKLQKKY